MSLRRQMEQVVYEL